MNEKDEAVLDRYLDGLLAGSEKSAFEKRIAGDPELRKQVELQRKIDAAVVSTLPPAPDVRTILDAARREKGKVLRLRPAFVAAIALAACVLVAALVYAFVFSAPPEKQTVAKLPHRTFEQVYEERLQAGFKPDWVCKDDAEFQTAYKKAVGQPLRLAKLEKNVEALGLAYANTLSPWTIALLAKVDGKEVIVFADPVSYDDKPTLAEGSKLHLHKRVLDKLVLYELSPFDAPRVLPSFEKP